MVKVANIDFYGELLTSGTITPQILRALEVARAYGLALIKARTPVDTGLLRANWNAVIDGRGIRWVNPTSYASYVELGTRKMRARNMLSDSLPDITRVFQEELGRQIAIASVSPNRDNIQEGYKGGYVGGTIESRAINNLRGFNRGADIGRRDLISNNRRQEIKDARPRWQAKPYSPDQSTLRF